MECDMIKYIHEHSTRTDVESCNQLLSLYIVTQNKISKFSQIKVVMIWKSKNM